MGLRWRRVLAAVCAVVLGLVVLAVPAGPASAAATVAFTPKFTANANGAILTVGNNLLTCPASAPGCAAARAGAVADDNGFTMVNLDVDGVASTVNSSSSSLDLPAGSTVLWAGLYWGARMQPGTGGQGSAGLAFNQMSFRAPGDAAYRTVPASNAARDQFGPNGSSYNAYQRFADVTAIVQAAGNGDYWGADVAAATGQDRYAGWALTVVYTAPGLPLRNLSVFDGFDVIEAGRPQTITVSGFQAPQAGTVDTQLTMVAYEGDLSQTGDFTRLNNTQLATAVSPGSNFFDSINSRNAASVTTRNPADRNMLGFDIKNLGASGAIPNGATSAQFTFSSNGDVYYPGVVGMAINLYAPDFTASSKTVVDLAGNNPAQPGDTLQYTLNYANTGQDPAVGVVSQDVLPPNTTFVPGSLALVNPLTGATTPLSDAAGDDRGELAGRTVRVRLGAGAGTAAAAGGTMACSGTGCTDDGTSRTAYTFQVTLDDAAGGTTVTNVATLDYRTATTGISATYTTNPASIDVVQQADVSIEKVMSPDPAPVGSAVTATLTVRNAGPNTATAVTVTDPVPAGWTGVTATAAQGTCAVGGGTVTCSLGDLPDGATRTVTLTGTTAASSTATTLTNVATVSTTASDPVPANNVAGDAVTLTRLADLTVSKTPEQQTAAPGAGVTWTLTVHNDGPSDASGVRIDDAFDVAGLATITGATVSVSAGQGASCTRAVGRSVRCAVAVLPAGATATVTVTGVLAAGLAEGTTVVNTVRAASDTPDPGTANNQDSATVVTTAPQADVRVTKTGPAAVVAGRQVTYTVTATNYGPSDAADVVLADPLPAGVTPSAAQPSRGACTVTGRDVACTGIGTLLSNGAGVAGGAVTVTITGTVDASATGTLTNTATESAATTDPAPANNAATASTTVQSQVDLAVSKTANRTTIPAEASTIPYVVRVVNNGPSTARDVTVTDLVPLVLDLDGVTSSGAGVTCDTSQADTPQPAPDDAQGLVTCAVPEILPGAANAVTITVTMSTDVPLTDVPGLDAIVQEVSVAAAGDTDPANDTAQWTLAGEPFTDLAITKTGPATAYAGSLPPGSALTPAYTIAVTNNTPNTGGDDEDAIRPVITDTLPAGVTLRGGTGAVTAQIGDRTLPLTCGVAGQVLTCQLGENLAAQATATLTVPVTIDDDAEAGTTLVNTASVATGDPEANPDNNLANNTAQATTTVLALADAAVRSLAITPLDPARTGPGSTWTLALTAGNNGPSTARDTEVRIGLAVVDAWVDLASLPAGCTVASTELVCPLGDIGFDETRDLTFTFTVTGYAEPGTYDGFAQISTTTPELAADVPNHGAPEVFANNRLTTTFDVTAAVTDLAVTKTALGTVPNPDEAADPDFEGDPHPSFVAGGPFTYQIAVEVPGQDPAEVTAGNTGLADARDVVVTDTLPVGFVVQQATAPGGPCTITPPADPLTAGYAIRCELGTVAGFTGGTPAQPAIVSVHGVLDPDANNLHGGDKWAEAVENTAVVTTATALPGGATSVEGGVVVDIAEIADLTVVKTPDSPTVNAGGTAGYTLTVVNAGPSGVEHAVVTDSLPVGFTLVPDPVGCPAPQTEPDDETQALPRVADGPGQEFACRVGAVPAGATRSVHVVATTDPAAAPGTFTNTAVVGSLANEADAADNTATADVTLERLADPSITSAVSTTTPAAGGEITYTAFTINNGPSSAWDVTGTTTFPPGFVPVSADVPLNTCTWNRTPPADPASVAWEDFSYVLDCVPLDPSTPFPPGVASTSVVVMHIPGDTPAGSYAGQAVVQTPTPEVTTDNNTTAQTVVVAHVSDTRLVKTLVEPDPMLAGGPRRGG
ncbi:DUF11 domain-containing protein [Xylanimonas protaetiae]|uniref:DUF11 domain-containing protein n=1 Tax=Xylanimonas protaetiae TaxID=2509457 RepID=A0A4P6F2K6_9MICO|nr:DUF11 domain-containing protein [Xylanimonas protaetiae]QAY69456.1 DUF11 domain-containing protein [Xylanimonas protaetiae]